MIYKKSLVITLVLVLLILPIAAAVPAEIEVRTEQGDERVVINVKSPVTGHIIGNERIETDSDGIGTVTIESTTSTLNFIVTVLQDGGGVKDTKEFNSQSILETIVLDMRSDAAIAADAPEESTDDEVADEEEVAPEEEPEEETPAEPETTTDDEEVTADEPEEPEIGSSPLTGNAVSALNDITVPNWVYYAVGALFLLGIVGMVISKRHAVVKAASSGAMSSDQEHKEIEKAEAKIKSAQKELNVIKNQDKIKKMQDKVTKEKDKLKKLQDGDDDEEEAPEEPADKE